MVPTKILKTDINWTELKNECRSTIGKTDTTVPPTMDFIKKLLISEHSPIRLGTIKWRWENIKSWVSVHFARHWLGWDKWVSTQRTDRTGIDRDEAPQNTPVNMDVNANIQALINVARYRLCYQASPETRLQMENLKRTITEEVSEEIGNVLVPNCIYRSGCPEFSMCKERFYALFQGKCIETNTHPTTIQQRYDLYNDFFKIKDSLISENIVKR